MSLYAELKRRNVFRVTMLYLVFSWLILQVADVLFGVAQMPAWSLTLVAIIIGLGFLPALVFAWIYELTPEGIKREKDIDRSQSITDQTGKKINASILLVLTIAVVILGVREFWPGEGAGDQDSVTGDDEASGSSQVESPAPDAGTAEDRRISVAVLPFVNMSGESENQYFSDGVAEELLNMLVKIDGLRVPSRTSSFRFRDANQSIAEIAEQLEVKHVLEGSVRKAGNQVRITAQLIDAASDEHLWSETYTRTLDDIFAIQDEIATAIVEELKVTLAADDSLGDAGTKDTEAYNHYLKGRYHWHQRTGPDFEVAERELRAAVEIDPDFAKAWSALADIYVLLPEYLVRPGEEAIPQARGALARALELEPRSAQALTTRAYLRFRHDWDYAAAEADFREALTIDPDYATAHQWLSELLDVLRRHEEALQSALRAYELDPLSVIKPHVVANSLWRMGRLDEAVDYYKRAIELSSDSGFPQNNLVRVRITQENWAEATKLVEELESLDLPPNRTDEIRVVLAAKTGEITVEEAVELIKSHPGCESRDGPYWLAELGAYAAAIEKLKICLESPNPFLPGINSAPAFEPMREMPAFREILRQLNLELEDPDS